MTFFYEFSALSHYKLPIATLYAPQFLDEKLKIETFIRRDFNLLNRYGFGISYRNFGFFWYSINVEEEFVNLFSIGISLLSIGSNAIYEYPNRINFGLGFHREFLNFSICAYTLINRFSYFCTFSEYKSAFFGFDIFLEKGYEMEYKIFFSYKLNQTSSISIGYGTNTNGFSIGYRYKFLIFNYFYHSYLGDSFGVRLYYEI
ncbi:MAG: hypothetical protein N2504_06320 [candidate division WOR-3 bacterium]|nr:hypothetical protein [candidate division WOR-3 bacterium]MCX7948183.1 hypothetical protein [candidate division WOR-3 bacterium]MDW8151120.1 hypothetical protein [candidate division WOR-3 bacterium]